MKNMLLALTAFFGFASASAVTVTPVTRTTPQVQFRTNQNGFPVIPNLKANNVYRWQATVITRRGQQAIFDLYNDQLTRRGWQVTAVHERPGKDQLRGRYRRSGDRVVLTVTQVAANRFQVAVQQAR